MLHEVVIQLQEDIAVELHEQRAHYKTARPVLRVAEELNVELVPHDSGTDDELDSFFSIMVSDAESAEHIAERFATCEGVSAAYVKPQGAPP